MYANVTCKSLAGSDETKEEKLSSTESDEQQGDLPNREDGNKVLRNRIMLLAAFVFGWFLTNLLSSQKLQADEMTWSDFVTSALPSGEVRNAHYIYYLS